MRSQRHRTQRKPHVGHRCGQSRPPKRAHKMFNESKQEGTVAWREGEVDTIQQQSQQVTSDELSSPITPITGRYEHGRDSLGRATYRFVSFSGLCHLSVTKLNASRTLAPILVRFRACFFATIKHQPAVAQNGRHTQATNTYDEKYESHHAACIISFTDSESTRCITEPATFSQNRSASW